MSIMMEHCAVYTEIDTYSEYRFVLLLHSASARTIIHVRQEIQGEYSNQVVEASSQFISKGTGGLAPLRTTTKQSFCSKGYSND